MTTKSECLHFVIQEHRARRAGLHYDLRLEVEGIFKSWVLRKDPPVRSQVKRLAIPVNDHPLAWGGFEGEIQAGYGAGTVKIWDRGTYQWVSTPRFPVTCQVFFNLIGKKLEGIYSMIPFDENFLFYKVTDVPLRWETAASLNHTERNVDNHDDR